MNKSYYKFAEDLVYNLEREQDKCGYKPVSVDFFEDFEALTSLAAADGLINLLNQALSYYFDLFPKRAAEFRKFQAKQITQEEREALLSILMELYDEDADEPPQIKFIKSS